MPKEPNNSKTINQDMTVVQDAKDANEDKVVMMTNTDRQTEVNWMLAERNMYQKIAPVTTVRLSNMIKFISDPKQLSYADYMDTLTKTLKMDDASFGAIIGDDEMILDLPGNVRRFPYFGAIVFSLSELGSLSGPIEEFKASKGLWLTQAINKFRSTNACYTVLMTSRHPGCKFGAVARQKLGGVGIITERELPSSMQHVAENINATAPKLEGKPWVEKLAAKPYEDVASYDLVGDDQLVVVRGPMALHDMAFKYTMNNKCVAYGFTGLAI